MVKAYAVALVLGLLGIVYVLFGGAIAEGTGRDERDPGLRLGPTGRAVIGGLVGFGMAGLSSEFSPLDLEWPAALGLAALGAVAGALWARFGGRVPER